MKISIFCSSQRVLQIRQSTLPNVVMRLQSESSGGGRSDEIFLIRCIRNKNQCDLDRPWDKSTRAVVYELPDVNSPAGLVDKTRK